MKVLLTGGAGYIGSTVANYFLDKGCEVDIIDNLSVGNKLTVPKKANFFKLSIQDPRVLQLLKKNNYDAVLHFAAYIRVEESVKNPNKYIKNNFYNSKKFLETCRKAKIKNFIFSSTASIYGYPKSKKKLINEKTEPNPQNPYALSKLKFEKYLIKRDLFKYIILRYFNVAGADKNLRSGQISKKESTHLIKKLCENYFLNKKIEIYGNDYPSKDGTAIRDYIHVMDLAEAHYKSFLYLLKNKKSKSKIYNCGYGKGYSVKQVIDQFNKNIKKKIHYISVKRRPGDVFKLVANNKKILKDLKLNFKFNSLNKILKSSLDWERKLH